MPLHRKKQLAYHTRYFYQVLLLDRGTTAGLLVHDDNDVGTLGSLPGQVRAFDQAGSGGIRAMILVITIG